MLHFIYFFSTNISTEYFKHAAHSQFFSSKCRLFRNATFFGSYVIHILHTGVVKFKCNIRMPKALKIQNGKPKNVRKIDKYAVTV
jgi:hypothetical protein